MLRSLSSRIAPQPDPDLRPRFDLNQTQRREKGPAPLAADRELPRPHDLFKSSTSEPAVEISYVPQDPGMLPVATEKFKPSQVQDGLINDRVRISEPRNFPTPHADKDGNYIYTPDNPRFDAAEAFVISNRALNMAEGYLGRDLSWGFSDDLGRDQIIVHPHAGANVANAFYSSEAGSLNFFSFTDPKTNEVLRTGSSADIVAHETGHALLDGIRHSYISSLTVAAGGFHESFGDMNSMLTALHDDAVVDKLYQQTGGDLSKPNLVARNAEMLGIAVGHMTNAQPEPVTLRDAINGFKYTDEHFLPFVNKKDPNGSPGQEPHAYSNLFTGAFYDVFSAVYGDVAKDGTKPFKQAVTEARDIAGKLLYRGVEFGPVGDPSYKNIALAFIKADQIDNGGKYRPLLEKVFTDRRILTADDLAAYDRHEASLPTTVKLTPDDLQSPQAAQAFLASHAKDLGVPEGTDLELMDVHGNDKGETFMLGGFAKDVALDGPEFGTLDGSKMRTVGGLTLAFDKDGKVIADSFQDVTPRDVEDIKDHLKVAINSGALGVGGADTNPSANDGTPKIYVSQSQGADGPVIQRSPIIWG